MRSLDNLSSFATADRSAQAVIAAEAADPDIRPQSRSILLSHGSRTRRAVLLLHGYRHGPEQMDELARDFFTRGYNVWIPRAPGHGTTDRRAERRITVESLTTYASQGMDIADGLGDEVGVVGISAGGILAAWLAQHRSDTVRRVLLFSPFFAPSPRQVPALMVRPLIFLYGHGLLPDHITSRGYSLATISRYLAIARDLSSPSGRTGLRSIAVAFSPLDDVVDTVAATAVPGRIADAAGIPVHTLLLPESLGFGHNTLALSGRPDAGRLREQYIQLYEGQRSTR
ncbi:alpha/beta hydrolase [Paractinoplanes hotanensis]|uniref:Alpha/beta fold hydrolase n=1 Tax=Paractinoplanes hotanensis TaxID=2906497 RepID=A0ABT0YE20_9ACTN|nr:alpha/beta fold hydrolase [Actinoplanes hotanensis]MCM4084292.1 alpha/beta fold hydrolase [Actinoplanes hotanensis]